MSYVIYVLLSTIDKKLYVGCTTNLDKRLEAHNTGKVPSTRSRKPLVMIHSETYDGKSMAFNRERFLKSLWGGRLKRRILRKYLENYKMG